MLKHFEMLSRVLQLYCNIVVHNQAEIKGDDWTDRKQIFHRTTILHTCPTKQAGVDCCCRCYSDTNSDTNALPRAPNFSGEFLRILIHTQLSRF